MDMCSAMFHLTCVNDCDYLCDCLQSLHSALCTLHSASLFFSSLLVSSWCSSSSSYDRHPHPHMIVILVNILLMMIVVMVMMMMVVMMTMTMTMTTTMMMMMVMMMTMMMMMVMMMMVMMMTMMMMMVIIITIIPIIPIIPLITIALTRGTMQNWEGLLVLPDHGLVCSLQWLVQHIGHDLWTTTGVERGYQVSRGLCRL